MDASGAECFMQHIKINGAENQKSAKGRTHQQVAKVRGCKGDGLTERKRAKDNASDPTSMIII